MAKLNAEHARMVPPPDVLRAEFSCPLPRMIFGISSLLIPPSRLLDGKPRGNDAGRWVGNPLRPASIV